jgi:hypothetical protein
MSEPLVTYVQDHLAGASHALDLLHWMSDAHKDDSLGTFARALHAEITEDRNVLVRIAQRIGAGSSASKEIGAWLSEKISRLKFANQGSTTIGTFESLEFLVLGIHGKRALWQALAVTARSDTRLEGVDYARLVSRAEMQEARVDDKRLEIAGPALRKAR